MHRSSFPSSYRHTELAHPQPPMAKPLTPPPAGEEELSHHAGISAWAPSRPLPLHPRRRQRFDGREWRGSAGLGTVGGSSGGQRPARRAAGCGSVQGAWGSACGHVGMANQGADHTATLAAGEPNLDNTYHRSPSTTTEPPSFFSRSCPSPSQLRASECGHAVAFYIYSRERVSFIYIEAPSSHSPAVDEPRWIYCCGGPVATPGAAA